MIRSLAPDELEWFLANHYRWIGHGDPRGFARRAVALLRDLDVEGDRSVALFEGGCPQAGAYLLAPEEDADDQNLYLSHVWYREAPEALARLLNELLRRNAHEAAHLPLYGVPPGVVDELEPALSALGFELEIASDMEFKLADLPPLGMPLVLEAWSDEVDSGFKEVYAAAEGRRPTDRHWAYLKRRRGRFLPDLWFIARETLDQPPVGYAFFGAHQSGVEGVYDLTAAGVLRRHRSSSEMLRRLLISSMHDLAARSPFGAIRTTLSAGDPKLIQILESLGFRTTHRYQAFRKLPR